MHRPRGRRLQRRSTPASRSRLRPRYDRRSRPPSLLRTRSAVRAMSCDAPRARSAWEAIMASAGSNVKDLLARAGNVLHRNVVRSTGGRVGGKGFGMPVVILTTTGRKSGKERTTVLTSPVQDGDRVVLVASYGGDDRNPAWFLNLRDNPDVELEMNGTKRPMKAHVASSEEKAELWPRVVAAHKGYGQYQTRTEREIPLVIL